MTLGTKSMLSAHARLPFTIMKMDPE
jgi:hypothetical protein